MNLTRYEQETIINFNEEERHASVYTHNKSLIKKLRLLSAQNPANVKMVRDADYRAEYLIPKTWIRINAPRKMTDEQRAAAALRLNANLRRETPTAVEKSDIVSAAEGRDIPEDTNDDIKEG